MKNEIRIFFTALMFYTRIPCPKWVDHSAEYLNKATRYLPLVGILVGGISALVFYGAQFVLPLSVSVILSLLAGIFTTGAFHEDGLADVCDGFGGGWTKEKILLIMKDSSIGAYGAIGLILLFSLKITLLLSVPAVMIPVVLISGHALSRFVALTFIFSHTYARDDDSSKSKPVAQKPPMFNLFIAAFFGVIPLLLFGNPLVFFLIIPMFLVKWYLGWYFKKWVGGYTGDCLGATQQIVEVVFYLSFVVLNKVQLWNFI
jgi:adenosylcobinamide-GDP ribazoletransferase